MDAVVLLHGWPGSTADFRAVRDDLSARYALVVPDLVGPTDDASAAAHARRVLAALDAAGHERAVFAGYDIGSRVAQAVARVAPGRVTGLVVTPFFESLAPLTAAPDRAPHLWYQHLHRLPLAEELIDGRRDAVAAYLRHFWSTWSANPALAEGPEFDALVGAYAAPGAFAASIAWYTANGYTTEGPIDLPAIVLWGDRDPLFPATWSAAAAESFPQAEVRILEGAGHFLPLEAPAAFVAAIDDLAS